MLGRILFALLLAVMVIAFIAWLLDLEWIVYYQSGANSSEADWLNLLATGAFD